MNELLEQIPPGILLYGMLVPTLALGLMIYLAVVRPALAKRRQQKAASLTAPAPAHLTAARPTTDAPVKAALGGDEDLPDLDALLAVPAAPAAAAPRPDQPRALGEVTVSLVTGKVVRAREELVLLRDPADGRLIVQMPNVSYKSFASAPAAKETFTRLMNELAKSLTQPDGAPAPAAPPVSVAPPAPKPAAPPPVIPPPVVPPSVDAPLPGDLPKYRDMTGGELKGRGFLGRPKFEFQEIPEMNIAASIEAYLQHRLLQTPGYAGRRWHVHAAPDGGVRIQIEDRFFEAVSDIDDPEARAFIQQAIQEWQDRQ
jgi:hypothetical protein